LPLLALAGYVALAGGCGRRVLGDDDGGTGHVTGAGGLGAFTGAGGGVAAASGSAGGPIDGSPRSVDILFMIDNSAATSLLQANLARNFPTFISTLENAPGGLPNLHLAVITSDMGAGDGSISSCSREGDAGRFQYTARGPCTATNLDPGATFISDVGGVRNYTGNLEDVFNCIAVVGNSGCGFEQPLASVLRALGADGRPTPAENQGFLRPEALLYVILLTNEDDCSVPPGSGLFDTANNQNLASPLGPASNFRCNEFGHLCNGVKPPRRAPTGSTADVVALDGCASAEGAGMLTPVATMVQQLTALKADPAMVMVAAIAGPATPYVVHWKNPSTSDTGPWPEIATSCIARDGTLADPAVRIAQWVSAFGTGGPALSVCADNYAPLLQTIADRLNQRLQPLTRLP
jgi:hypothetical protein